MEIDTVKKFIDNKSEIKKIIYIKNKLINIVIRLINNYEKISIVLYYLLLLANISSCGYQLRGAKEVNFESISIDGGSPSFVKILKKKFKQSGVKVQERNSEKILR